MDDRSRFQDGKTVGVDMGDRWSRYCVLDEAGKVLGRERVWSTEDGFRADFAKLARMRFVIEAGTHSPWASRLLAELGHEVIVANPRKLRLIYKSNKKNDHADAEALARLGRVDPELLAPIQHRGKQAQADLALIRARDALVRSRTQLVNHVRGAVKSVGGRLPSSSTASFAKHGEHIPKELWRALSPLLDTIDRLSREIQRFDRRIEKLASKTYPDAEQIRQVPGVGPLTAVAYVLTIEDAKRFERSRQVGAYLGLTPRQDQSGNTDRQLGITKAGDEFLRRLLVGSAQYTLGPFCADSDLRRWGLKLAERGGKNAKRRAVVAVARKLAVLLHRLWRSGATYVPLRHGQRRGVEESAQAIV